MARPPLWAHLRSRKTPLKSLSLTSVVIAVFVLLLVLLAFWLWTPDKTRGVLESRYLAAPGDMVQVGAWRLHVRESGPKDAPAVLMLHGFGASLHTWDDWAKSLSANHRVIRLDLPGHGLSEPDPAGDYTDARSLQLVLALMDQLGVARASIVGHSIGGRIAWTFAARHPQRTDKLVLVAPDGFASPGFEYGKAAEVPAVLGLMRYVMPKSVLRMNLAPAYANPAVLTDEITTRYHDLMLAPGGRNAMLMRLQQTVLTDPLPLLSSIAAPTLLVWGEADAMIPVANAQDYLRAVKGSRLVTFPATGHLPQEEAAQASLKAVAEFLRP
jgi:pimeloyl-ACP methyl ester carboxylesterase